MKLAFRILLGVLSASLGIVFLYSAYTKLLPVIETFEFTFVEIGIANWYTAPIIARLMIGLEIFIGILLILNYNLRSLTIPFTIGLLIFFIIYLLIQIAVSGNNGNCGCFGEHLKMTPFEAILKNIVMIALSIPIYMYWPGWRVRYRKLFYSFIGLTALIVPYLLNPVDYTYTTNNLDEEVNYKLNLDPLYEPEDTSKVQVPKIELRTGKHVLAFMSLTCPHCRIAAKKFRLIQRNNPDLPIYFILNGDRDKLKPFYEDTKSENIKASMALGKTFVSLSGLNLPKIYYLDNGVVVKKVDYYELNQYDIEKWIKGEK